MKMANETCECLRSLATNHNYCHEEIQSRYKLYCQNLEFSFTTTNFLLTGKNPLRGRKSALGCSAIEEVEKAEDCKLSGNIMHILKLL
jgi:hypothetical protein